MGKNCETCEILKNPKHQVLSGEHWIVSISNNQAYFGRAYVTLLSHKGSLGELSRGEWSEFEELVGKLEQAYKQAFGAEPLNWGCFMNNAYKESPPRPHVHWHIFPRYKKAPILNGKPYEDENFAHHYNPKALRLVDDEIAAQIVAKLRKCL